MHRRSSLAPGRATPRARQQQWDGAAERHKTLSERADAIRAQRETGAQETRDAAAAQDEARQVARREQAEAMLHSRIIAAGGTPQEWDVQKDQLVADHVKQQALSGRDPAREAQASLYRNF